MYSTRPSARVMVNGDNRSMARSNSEQLSFYREWRDDIEDALAANAGNRMSSFTIRNRTVTYADALRELEYVEKQISKYQALTQTDGSTRNSVRLKR